MNYIKRKDKIGMIKVNKQGTEMKIIDDISEDEFLIEFQDKHKFQTVVFYQNFKRGTVKNPFDKTICNIGYVGDGKYKTVEPDGKLTKIYVTWHDLLVRCYKEEIRYKHPAYADCTVCNEWHNFQVFAKWYEENFYQVDNERMHIDKDILVKDNTIYSPSTCLIVPQRINMIFMNKPNKYNLPSGIQKNKNYYSVSYNGVYKGGAYLLENAIVIHDKYKRLHIKQIAEEYKNKIPEKVYNALLNW